MSQEVLGWGAEELLDRVSEDPKLTPKEKETTLRFAKDENVVHTFTREGALMRRFLAHPLSEVQETVLEDGSMVREPDVALRRDGSVVSVKGKLPIGVLKMSKKARATEQHAPIISDAGLGNGGGGE